MVFPLINYKKNINKMLNRAIEICRYSSNTSKTVKFTPAVKKLKIYTKTGDKGIIFTKCQKRFRVCLCIKISLLFHL